MHMHNQRPLTLCAALMLMLLCGCSSEDKNNTDADTPTLDQISVLNVEGTEISHGTSVPTLNSISILSAEGTEISQEETGWFLLPELCTIKIDYSGTVTKAEFYATPTGTETNSLTDLIGTVDVDPVATAASLEWEPNGFMGYISVVIYNDSLAVSSEDSWLIKVISDE